MTVLPQWDSLEKFCQEWCKRVPSYRGQFGWPARVDRAGYPGLPGQSAVQSSTTHRASAGSVLKSAADEQISDRYAATTGAWKLVPSKGRTVSKHIKEPAKLGPDKFGEKIDI